MFGCVCRPVYPHPGVKAGLQRPGEGVLRLAACGGPARQAGVLHRHHEDLAAQLDGELRGKQEPQTHAAQVCVCVCVCLSQCIFVSV